MLEVCIILNCIIDVQNCPSKYQVIMQYCLLKEHRLTLNIYWPVPPSKQNDYMTSMNILCMQGFIEVVYLPIPHPFKILLHFWPMQKCISVRLMYHDDILKNLLHSSCFITYEPCLITVLNCQCIKTMRMYFLYFIFNYFLSTVCASNIFSISWQAEGRSMDY